MTVEGTHTAGVALYHLAVATDWEAAVGTGRYERSTLGRSLAEVGFIHLSRADQLAATAARFYCGRDDVVLLTVDPGRLDAAVVDEPVGDDVFPHLYGPLPVGAVIAVHRLAMRPDGTHEVPDGLLR